MPREWPSPPSPHGKIEAGAILELLWLLEPRERRALVFVGEDEQVSERFRNMDSPIRTALSWHR